MAKAAPPTISLSERALLPAGFQDALPPLAEFEVEVTAKLMSGFGARGYERVSPPLMEFEPSMRSVSLGSKAERMFRVLDPVSNAMMVLRSDITLQVARLAATRLAKAPRPLRLCYSGHVARVRGSQLRPNRQFRQAGAELIGADQLRADAEIICMALDSLSALGLTGLTLDLNHSGFVATLVEAWDLTPSQAMILRDGLDAKDAGAIAALPDGVQDTAQGVLNSAGPAANAIPLLAALALPAAAQTILDDATKLVGLLQSAMPNLPITLDFGDYQGFDHLSGIGFSLFADRVAGPLCRGGRYVVHKLDGTEPAVGFSIYLDGMMQAVRLPALPSRLYVPFDHTSQDLSKWRNQGYRTVAGLAAVADIASEARRLNCGHYLEGESVVAVSASD